MRTYISEMRDNFSTEGMQRHQRPPTWHQIKYNLILLSKIKTNRIIASYRRYYRSFHLLLPLVLTVTTLKISRFQAPETHDPSLGRFKIFQELVLRLQNPQLNDLLASLVRLRSIRFSKNNEPFSNSHFVLCQ